MILEGFAVPAYALATRRRALIAQLRPIARRGLLGGVLSVFAYGLVLAVPITVYAQSRRSGLDLPLRLSAPVLIHPHAPFA